jgi:hypothetical protein
MQIRLLPAILILLAASGAPASETNESIAHEIGQSARQIHDSVQDANQTAGHAAQRASDWFIGQLSVAGESISGLTKNIGSQFDLFFYEIRQGYESNP